jgi:alpha-galactosidase
MLGDLRLLDEQKTARLRRWAAWFRDCQERHGILAFRQDLRGFGEPADGRWDGYARINTDTKTGGILGVFRESAGEKRRTVFVDGLEPDTQYVIRRAPDGEVVTTAIGRILVTEGVEVLIEEATGARLFEVRRKDR